jgi:23S rRNA (guanosine2251-2'-O)-methyltransferase
MQKNQVIYGVHPVVEAMEQGKELEKIFLQAGLKHELTGKLRKMADHNGVVVQTVPIEKLNRLVRGNHQGVVGFISSISYVEIETLIPGIYEEGRSPLILVLDRVTDVRNFGGHCTNSAMRMG